MDVRFLLSLKLSQAYDGEFPFRLLPWCRVGTGSEGPKLTHLGKHAWQEVDSAYATEAQTTANSKLTGQEFPSERVRPIRGRDLSGLAHSMKWRAGTGDWHRMVRLWAYMAHTNWQFSCVCEWASGLLEEGRAKGTKGHRRASPNPRPEYHVFSLWGLIRVWKGQWQTLLAPEAKPHWGAGGHGWWLSAWGLFL